MRAVAVLALTSALLASNLAQGADLPAVKSAPAPIVVSAAPFTWTGVYGGFNVGAATDRYTFNLFAENAGYGSFAERSTINSRGPIGGGQIGIDYQTPWRVVVGVAADLDAAGVSGNTAAAGPLTVGVGGIGAAAARTHVSAFGSLRARIGYAFGPVWTLPGLLIYLTGGAAYTHVTDEFAALAGPGATAYSRSRSLLGLGRHRGVVGIGAEVPVWTNTTIGVDYRYQYTDAATVGVGVPPVRGAFGTRAMYHLVRLNVNYRFNLF